MRIPNCVRVNGGLSSVEIVEVWGSHGVHFLRQHQQEPHPPRPQRCVVVWGAFKYAALINHLHVAWTICLLHGPSAGGMDHLLVA
eukprot:346788-Chlamydomonas_euryale.AAC.1